MAWQAIAANLMSQAGSGSSAPPVAMEPDNFAPISPINVAPIGVNLGEIIKGTEQGGVTNGRSGASLPSRYAQNYTVGNGNIPAESADSGPVNVMVWGGAALILGTGAFILFRKRRG